MYSTHASPLLSPIRSSCGGAPRCFPKNHPLALKTPTPLHSLPQEVKGEVGGSQSYDVDIICAGAANKDGCPTPLGPGVLLGRPTYQRRL